VQSDNWALEVYFPRGLAWASLFQLLRRDAFQSSLSQPLELFQPLELAGWVKLHPFELGGRVCWYSSRWRVKIPIKACTYEE